MDGPYGLAYGMGQAGAGLLQGMQQRPIYQAQVEGLNLQNQMREAQVQQQQMNLAQQQAENDALSHTVEPIDKPLTPHDQQVADLKEAIKNVPPGQGMVRSKLMQQALAAAQSQHAYQIGSAGKALLGNDFDTAKKYLAAAGQPVDDIQVDPASGNYMVKFQGHDEPMPMSKQGIYALLQDPEKMQNFAHTLAANDQYMANLGFKQDKLQQEMEAKRQHFADQAKNWENMARYREVMGKAATVRASASAQNAATGARRLATDPDRQFMDWATDPRQGNMDQGQAYTMLRESRQGQAAGKSSNEIAQGIVAKTWPKGAEFDPDAFNKHVAAVAQGIDALGPSPAVAARNRLRAGTAGGTAAGGGPIPTIKSVTAKNALPPGTKYKDRSGNLHTRGTGMGPADE